MSSPAILRERARILEVLAAVAAVRDTAEREANARRLELRGLISEARPAGLSLEAIATAAGLSRSRVEQLTRG